MVSKTIMILNQRGLHARASSKLAKLAGQFDMNITVSKGSEDVVATSIMGLMMLGAAKGDHVTITVEDAEGDKSALTAVCDLIDQRFGESE